MGVFKVDNPQVWAKVKSGDYRGISLEGLFSHELIKASLIELSNLILEKDLVELTDEEANMVLNKIKHIIKNDNRYRKGQRIDKQNMEGEGGQPSIISSYPGQFGPGKKKKAKEAYIHPALIGTKK